MTNSEQPNGKLQTGMFNFNKIMLPNGGSGLAEFLSKETFLNDTYLVVHEHPKPFERTYQVVSAFYHTN